MFSSILDCIGWRANGSPRVINLSNAIHRIITSNNYDSTASSLHLVNTTSASNDTIMQTQLRNLLWIARYHLEVTVDYGIITRFDLVRSPQQSSQTQRKCIQVSMKDSLVALMSPSPSEDATHRVKCTRAWAVLLSVYSSTLATGCCVLIPTLHSTNFILIYKGLSESIHCLQTPLHHGRIRSSN